MSEKERIEYQRRRASEIFKNLYQNHQLARQRAAEQAKKVEVRLAGNKLIAMAANVISLSHHLSIFLTGRMEEIRV